MAARPECGARHEPGQLKNLDDGFVAIISDNMSRHPIEVFKPGRDGKLTLIGKVKWWDNRL